MTKLSKCGKYGVEIIENGRNAEYGYIVCAVFNDGLHYGGTSYWFSIGHYKTLAGAQRQSIKKMAAHNIEIEF